MAQTGVHAAAGSARSSGARATEQGVANARKPGSDRKPAGRDTSGAGADVGPFGHAGWTEFVNAKLDKRSADAQKAQKNSK